MKLWYETVLPIEQAENDKHNKADIVFLHGTGSNAHMWENQAAFFSQKGYKCILIDLRGHGQSDEPNEKISIEVYTQDVFDTLQGSNIKFPAYFVGHSLGGIIALAVAEKHPESVKAVFAACIPAKLIKPMQYVFKLFISGLQQALKESRIKYYLPWREQTLIETPLFTMKEIADFFSKCDLLEHIPQVNCPVHISAARFDPFAVHWQTKKIHAKLADSTFQIFEWAGHNVMDYRPQDFNKWILSHLDI